jgi:hypothetical protein
MTRPQRIPRFSRARAGAAGALVFVLLFACGCGDPGGGRVAFTGRVTRGGVPLERGSVAYLPKEGHAGPAASAEIVQGAYQFTTSDGPLPGPHRVLISVPGLGNKSAGAAAPPQPTKWESDVLVTAPGDFDADFDLESP